MIDRIYIPVDHLINDFKAGMKLNELARKYYCSIGVVHNRLRDAGVKRKNYPAPTKEELWWAYTVQKRTIHQLAFIYGVSDTWIRYRLKGNKIKTRPRGGNQRRRVNAGTPLTIFYLLYEKKTVPEIAERLQISITYIRNVINRGPELAGLGKVPDGPEASRANSSAKRD